MAWFDYWLNRNASEDSRETRKTIPNAVFFRNSDFVLPYFKNSTLDLETMRVFSCFLLLIDFDVFFRRCTDIFKLPPFAVLIENVFLYSLFSNAENS